MKIPVFLVIIKVASVFTNSLDDINSTASQSNLDSTTQPIPTINQTISQNENIKSTATPKNTEITSVTQQITTITTPSIKICSNITKSNAINSSSTTTPISTTHSTATISSSSNCSDDTASSNSTITTLVDSNTPHTTTTTSSPISSDAIASSNSTITTLVDSNTPPTTTTISSPTSSDAIASSNSTIATLVDSDTPPTTTTTSSPTSSDAIVSSNSTITTLVDNNTAISNTSSSSNTTFSTNSSTTPIPTTTTVPFNPEDWRNTKILTKKGLDLQNHADNSTQIASPADGDFQSLIRDSSLWVDKSLLIREIWENRRAWDLIITAPPKWGKTINLSMFKFYCDLSLDSNGIETPRTQSASHLHFNEGKIVSRNDTIEDLDEAPLISGYNEHLADHPVIYISGYNLSINDALESFRTMIHETYRRHESFLNRLNIECSKDSSISQNVTEFSAFYDPQNVGQLNETYLTQGIQILSRLLFDTYHRKVIVLFDDYDKYIQNAYFDTPSLSYKPDNEQKFVKIWDTFVQNTFQKNGHLEKAIFSGVLKVRDPGCLPGYQNYYNANVFDDEDLFPYYGFFEIEFDQLATKRGIDKSVMDNATQWYGGYRTLSNSSHQMFSPYSVVQFVNTLQIQNYWSNSSFTEFMVRLLRRPVFWRRIHGMIGSFPEGKTFRRRYTPFKRLSLEDYEMIQKINEAKIYYYPLDEDILFAVFVSSGYLSVFEDGLRRVYIMTKIPNREIHTAIGMLMRYGRNPFMEYN